LEGSTVRLRLLVASSFRALLLGFPPRVSAPHESCYSQQENRRNYNHNYQCKISIVSALPISGGKWVFYNNCFDRLAPYSDRANLVNGLDKWAKRVTHQDHSGENVAGSKKRLSRSLADVPYHPICEHLPGTITASSPLSGNR
jgi:hypothetical protein